MDKFVIRKPTWKTKSYETMRAESLRKRGECANESNQQINSKSMLKCEQANKKQLDVQQDTPDLSDRFKCAILKEREHILNSFLNTTPRRSVRDFGKSLSDNLTSTRLTFGGICESSQIQNKRGNQDLDSPLSDTIQNEKEDHENNAEDLQNLPTKSDNNVDPNQPPLDIVATGKTTLALRAGVTARIQSDLQSPSALIRSRAISAIRNPIASCYNNFDVPHEEQSIITEEERHAQKPKSLNEIFQNVVIYVEVRAGEDNRSEGVKKVIASMGARVNDRLLRSTTHVVFKDGLLSTFKKARSLNIPVVSILWIEACRKEVRLCDPAMYPISNLHIYEDPELYPKIPRKKFIQPDSESKKRIRQKPATPSSVDVTPVKNGSRQRMLAGKTPTSAKPKSDIKQYFQVMDSNQKGCDIIYQSAAAFESPVTSCLNRITNDFHTPLQAKISELRIGNNDDNDSLIKTQLTSENNLASDLSKLLLTKRINSNDLTPLQSNKSKCATLADTLKGLIDGNKSESNVKADENNKTLQKYSKSKDNIILPSSSSSINSKSCKKRNLFAEVEDKENSSTISVEATAPAPRRSQRRKTLDASTNTSKTLLELVGTPDLFKQRRRSIQSKSKTDLLPTVSKVSSSSSTMLFKSIAEEPIIEIVNNATNYSEQSLEISEVPSKEQCSNKRRRTLLTPDGMDITEKSEENVKDKELSNKKFGGSSSSDMAICLTPVMTSESSLNSRDDLMSVDSNSNVPQFSSTRLPSNKKRLTLYDVSMEIINQRILSINASSSRRSLAQVPDTQIASSISSDYYTPKSRMTNSAIKLPSQTETAEAATTVDNTETTSTVKKRKLFVPNPEIESKDLEPTPQSSSSNTKTNRRRTIAASTLSLPAKDESDAIQSEENAINKQNSSESVNEKQSTAIETTATVKKKPVPVKKPIIKRDTRRSTLAFEQKKPIASKKEDNKNEANSEVTKTQVQQTVAEPPRTPSVVASGDNKNKKLATLPTKGDGDHTVAGKTQATKKLPTKQKHPIKLATMVYTNMHREQINVIRKAVNDLGYFKLNHIVNDETTHLVSLEPRRTLNMLRGLMGGVWILKYTWILDSIRAGAWVREEHYEMHAFSRAVEICRAERQAFGKNYRCELFQHMEPFYVANHCKNIPKVTVKELLSLGNANITEYVWRAKYVIGDKRREDDDKIYLSADWVMDSIQAMQIQRFYKYLMPSCIIIPKHPTYEIRQPVVERVFQVNSSCIQK